MLFSVQTIVTRSGNAEVCLFSCVDVFSDNLNMSPVLRPQTQPTQKLARSTAHSNTVLQTQFTAKLRSLSQLFVVVFYKHIFI